MGRVRALAVDAAANIFAVVSGAGVFKSADGGNTFAKVGAPANAQLPALAMSTMALNALGEPVVGVVPSGATGVLNNFIYRYDHVADAWTLATMAPSRGVNSGGYFVVGFRRDVDGTLLGSWPFRNDIMRSTDGSNWDLPPFAIPNATHVPPNGPSALVKAVYGVAVHPRSGEILCGTEGDQWWHSTDHGATWSMVDGGGTSNLALEPGQNGFMVSFNKDGEPLVGTQGKSDGHFLMRLTVDGQVVSSDVGFPIWGMVGTATMGLVLREVVLTDEGYNFLAMPVANGAGGQLPPDLWGSPDGRTWKMLGAPFTPELNAVAAYGAGVLVGGGALSAGMIWKFDPTLPSHLPRVTTGYSAGQAATCTLASGLMLQGAANDADNDPLTFTWHARGPGPVAFDDVNAANTHAAFSVAGDYVLTLRATDGVRSAGAPLVVHVTP